MPQLNRKTEPGNFGLSDDLLLKIWSDQEQLAAGILSIHQHEQPATPEAKHTPRRTEHLFGTEQPLMSCTYPRKTGRTHRQAPTRAS